MKISFRISLKCLFLSMSAISAYVTIVDKSIRHDIAAWLGFLSIIMVTVLATSFSLKISESYIDCCFLNKRIGKLDFKFSSESSCSISNFPLVLYFGNGNRQLMLPRFFIANFSLICAYLFANFPGQFEDDKSLQFMKHKYLQLYENGKIPDNFGNPTLIRERLKK